MDARLSLGIDIGGTFTDIVVLDPESGDAAIWKESTTPADPAAGAIQGLAHLLAARRIDASRIGRVVHATTLFTNALIERKGAPTGLLTTAGFRDVLEIGHERKFELYDIAIAMPPALVPRVWRREVAERLAQDGAEEIPLDEAGLLGETEALLEAGVRSLAIVFLHACTNAQHEERAAAAIAARFPGVPVSLSSAIAPEIGEYARASTTVANAYIQPLAASYLDRLAAELARIGVVGRLFLMLSNGGLADLAEAKRRPVALLESGPAAGALAGACFARAAGRERVLAFDMGGTTAKLAVVEHGKAELAHAFEAARQKRFLRGSGLPIRIPTIELIEIGAGGGSIARKSDLGTLAVGPESAGAVPGPACYGRGGRRPTVTDADLLLGHLDADYFLGGAMPIDAAAARRAISDVADAVGVETEAAAAGIHEVVTETMAGAARVAIAERGEVPQHYALLATGGSAPVHAWQMARKLGLREIICPPAAGVGSTLGMLMAPVKIDRIAAFVGKLATCDWQALFAIFRRLEDDAESVLAATGADPATAEAERLADMRYVGQGSEVTIALPDAVTVTAVRETFEERYRQLFTANPPGAEIAFTALRLVLTAPAPGGGGMFAFRASADGPAQKGVRNVCFGAVEQRLKAPVFNRYALAPGRRIQGPAVIEENESTLVIGPGGDARVLANGVIEIAVPE